MPLPRQDRSTPSPVLVAHPEVFSHLKRPSAAPHAIRRAFTNFIPMLVYKTSGGPAARRRPQEAFVSLIERLHRANAEMFAHQEDPWRRALERALPANLACTSTVALLALLEFPATTGNARRRTRTMRSMGWVGIKSRRLAPGGWRTTTCRGWSRPVREPRMRQPCCPNDLGSTQRFYPARRAGSAKPLEDERLRPTPCPEPLARS